MSTPPKNLIAAFGNMSPIIEVSDVAVWLRSVERSLRASGEETISYTVDQAATVLEAAEAAHARAELTRVPQP